MQVIKISRKLLSIILKRKHRKQKFQVSVGGRNIIKCLMDVSVPEDSKCANCCIQCEEKDTCEYKCYGIEKWKTEEEIAKNCVECWE